MGKVGDHFVDPYASHISHITGIEIVAEKLGLVRKEEGGDLEPAKAAQNDHDGDGIPSSAPLHSKPAALKTDAPTEIKPAAAAVTEQGAATEAGMAASQAAPAASEESGDFASPVEATGIDGKVDTAAETMAAAAAVAQGGADPTAEQ